MPLPSPIFVHGNRKFRPVTGNFFKNEFGYDNLDTGYVGWVEGGILGQPVDPRVVFQPQYQGVQLATCVGDDRPRSWACNETQNNFRTRIWLPNQVSIG